MNPYHIYAVLITSLLHIVISVGSSWWVFIEVLINTKGRKTQMSHICLQYDVFCRLMEIMLKIWYMWTYILVTIISCFFVFKVEDEHFKHRATTQFNFFLFVFFPRLSQN